MAADYFLKIEGVKGESQDEKHKDEIDVIAFSFGGDNSSAVSAGSGSGGGKGTLHPFNFTHKYDIASPTLMKKMAEGEHFPSAKLVGRKSGGSGGQKEYFEIEMKEFYIAGLSSSGDPSGEMIESVQATCAEFKINYKPQDNKGALGAPVEFTWDVKKNTVK